MSYKLGLRTRVAWAISICLAFLLFLASTIVSRAQAAPAAASSFVYVASSSDLTESRHLCLPLRLEDWQVDGHRTGI